jgi:prolipoprotein diacylglyceryltransferase
MIMTWAIWYGSVRIITDFLRVDKRFFGLTGSQWTSIAVVTASAVTLIVWAIRPRPGPKPLAVGASPPGGTDVPTTHFVPPREPGGGP